MYRFEVKGCVLLSLMSGMPPAFDLRGAAGPDCGAAKACCTNAAGLLEQFAASRLELKVIRRSHFTRGQKRV